MNKLFITLYVLQLTVAHKLATKVSKVRSRESGQGALEYIGMIAVAAVIIAAVAVAVQSVGIGEWVKSVIQTIKDAPFKKPG